MRATACHACGADLSSVTGMTCPACGARPDVSTPRAADAPPPAHELAKPAIILVLSLGAIALYLTAGWSYPVATAAAAVGLQALLGVAVFVVCTMTWLGADDPLPINLLRLASIYAATWAALFPITHLPLIYFMMLIIPFGIFVVLHITLLGLELAEAFVLAMLNLCVYIAAGFVLIAG